MRVARAVPTLPQIRLPRVAISSETTATAVRWSLVAAGVTLPYALAHWL